MKKSIILFLIIAIITNNVKAQNIHSAASQGKLDAIKEILKKDPEKINDLNRDQRTALQLAIMSKRNEIARYLISEGADIYHKSKRDETALFFAVNAGNMEMVKLLISKNTLKKSVLSNGTNMLHLAALSNHPEFINILIDNGIDINAINKKGLTALHIASAFGLNNFVEKLIKNGADLNLKSTDGGSPLHYAISAGHKKNASTLLAAGAEKKKQKFAEKKGEYLGMDKPGMELTPFNTGFVININIPHGGTTFSPDGKEMYWTRTSFSGYESIWYMKEEKGKWHEPKVAPFSTEYHESHPCFSMDGKKIIFCSDRPLNKGEAPGNNDIWIVEKDGDNWGKPKNLGIINTPGEDFLPTICENDNLYFIKIYSKDGRWGIDIFCSEFVNGEYTEPVKLPEPINSPYVEARPLIAPDESYILFTSDRPGGTRKDLESYVTFKQNDGLWNNPIPTGFKHPPQGISADGKYILFGDYWVKSDILKKLYNNQE
ncbi:ankyrin repeat domain-containing protein [Bacteroidota bacterium]